MKHVKATIVGSLILLASLGAISSAYANGHCWIGTGGGTCGGNPH